MTILIVVLHVFVCFFLIAVILLQAGRGQGLSWGVFGGTPQSILGTKTATFLSRVTTVCASIFLVTCIGLNMIEMRKSRSLFAPSTTASQIDLSKVKEALKEAEKQIPPDAAVPPQAEDVIAEAIVNETPKAPEASVPAIAETANPAPQEEAKA